MEKYTIDEAKGFVEITISLTQAIPFDFYLTMLTVDKNTTSELYSVLRVIGYSLGLVIFDKTMYNCNT